MARKLYLYENILFLLSLDASKFSDSEPSVFAKLTFSPICVSSPEIFADVLPHHESEQKRNRGIDIASIL